jgi:membrane protein
MKIPPIITQFTKLLKRIVIPGFDGVSMYEILAFFFKGIWEGALTMRASAVAFNFFLALFPSLIFLFTIIPYIPIEGFHDMLFETLQDVLPNTTYNAVKSTAEDIITKPQGGLLSLGFILALFFSTTGVNSLIEAFNQTYHNIEKRSFFKQQLISLILVLILSSLVIVGIGLLIFGNVFIDFIVRHAWIDTTFELISIQIIKFLIVIIIFFFAISFLYYLGPSRKQKFRFISAGSTLSTLLIILLSLGFNYYIDNFSRYNTLYGSIGTLIIVMLWIYFIAMVIIIGFELNASIKNARMAIK